MNDSRIPEHLFPSKPALVHNKETALAWKRQGQELVQQGRVSEGRELLMRSCDLLEELVWDSTNFEEKSLLRRAITEIELSLGSSSALTRYSPVTIGVDKESGEKVLVSPDDLFSGTLIVGVTGSGKTSIMTNIALERISAGGESVIVLDPSGSMIRDISARLPLSELGRTYYLTVKEDKNLYAKHPFSLNLFSYPNAGSAGVATKQAARNQIALAFSKLFPSTTEGVYFNEILRNLTPILLDHPTFTLYQVEDFLLDERFRKNILRTIDNPRTLRYWQRFNSERPQDQREVIRPFLRRLNELLDDDFLPYHIGQKRGLLDIRQAILNKEILLIDLPLDQMAYREAAKAIGTLLMMQIYAATFSFLDYRGEKPTFTLLVDEFAKWVYNSGDEFTDLLQYGRKYGIRQVLATQHTSQLDEEGLPKSLKDGITGAKTKIALRTTLQDRKVLAPLFASIGRKPVHLHRDTLNHLEDAKNTPFIKEFYWRVVRPLEAAKRNTEKRDVSALYSGDYREGYIYDFGFGETEYTHEQITHILTLLNDLFYFTQLEQKVNEERMRELVYEYMLLNGFVRIQLQRVRSGPHEEEAGKLFHTGRFKLLPPAKRKEGLQKIQEDYYELKTNPNPSYRAPREKAPACQPMEVIDEEGKRKIDTLFRTICNMLLQQPLAMEEPPSQTEEEMANILHQLPDREGYAEVGNVIYSIRTAELPPRLPDNEVTARWNTILRQTKEKYARKGRTEIKNEILQAFVDDTGQHDRLDELDHVQDF